ncbi:MAG TPA: DNA-binding response regulator [Enterococcus sp.]|nr:DNA-binding response regulator [Enterococcus sp.]
MTHIFILEDDIVQQQQIERFIRDILLEHKWRPTSINATAKPLHLLEKLEHTVGENIYFLDIQIQGDKKKGLETAQAIRAIDPHGLIAFISTHAQYAPITYTYKVSAFDFIDKDSDPLTIRQHLLSCLRFFFDEQNGKYGDEQFIFKTQTADFQLPFRSIYYFETTDISHKLRLIGHKRSVNFYGTLQEVQEMDPRFYQVHRSFVVNLTNIVAIDRKEGLIHFNDEKSCLVSRRKIRGINNQLKNLSIHIES